MTGQLGRRTTSAASRRKIAKIDRERLAAVDFYHFLDWIREGWDDDEHLVVQRMQRLKWHLEELPEPFRSQGREEYAVLTRARMVSNQPWLAALTCLRRIVSEWDRSRPALIVCGIDGCQIAYRTTAAMESHRDIFHDEAA